MKTIKIITVSVGCVGGYSRLVVRVVRCLPEQRGHKSERGVDTLWESAPFYSSSRGPKSNRVKALNRAAEFARNPNLLETANV